MFQQLTMKTTLLCCSAILAIHSAQCATAAPIQLTSPNGKLVLGLSTADSGTFGYSLAGHGTPLISHSALGLDFGPAGKAPASGWQIADTKTRSVNSTWKPLWGKRAVVPDRYRETTIELSGPGAPFDRITTHRPRLRRWGRFPLLDPAKRQRKCRQSHRRPHRIQLRRRLHRLVLQSRTTQPRPGQTQHAQRQPRTGDDPASRRQCLPRPARGGPPLRRTTATHQIRPDLLPRAHRSRRNRPRLRWPMARDFLRHHARRDGGLAPDRTPQPRSHQRFLLGETRRRGLGLAHQRRGSPRFQIRHEPAVVDSHGRFRGSQWHQAPRARRRLVWPGIRQRFRSREGR